MPTGWSSSDRSNYYDIGAAYPLTPQVTPGIDAYDRRVRRLQDEGQFGNALIFSDFNYAKGRSPASISLTTRASPVAHLPFGDGDSTPLPRCRR
ncbi:MAG: hypothetical protein M3R22_05570 [Pseudomonadota bacterium]|nr:hypothetical protein [Pseudomonadota bacterium]